MIDRFVDLALRWILPGGETGEEIRTDLAREADERSRGRSLFHSSLWRLIQGIRIAVRFSLHRRTRRGARSGGAPDLSWLHDCSRDVRFGLRILRRRPLFTLVSLSALGIGIGATTTVFSVMKGVLFPELPFHEPQELVNGWPNLATGTGEWRWGRIDYDQYLAWRSGAVAVEDVSIHAYANIVLWEGDQPQELTAGEASSSFLSLLGLSPVIGRWFTAGETGPNFQRVVVLGEGFWRQQYGSDPDVIGRTVELDREQYTVIGVAPEELNLLGNIPHGENNLLSPRQLIDADLWLPITPFLNGSFDALARLSPGATIERASAEAQALTIEDRDAGEYRFNLVRIEAMERAGLPSQIVLIGIPASLLLLIACGNVALLLLGEGLARRQEFSTRIAIGAGRGHVLRQLLTESGILGLLGAVLGIGLSYAGTAALVGAAPLTARIHEIGVDVPVLLFSVGTGVLVGMVFGLAPGLRLSDHPVPLPGSRIRGVAVERKTAANVIISAEVAGTVLLLVMGALFLRTVDRLFDVDLGFDPADIVSMRVAVEDGRSYPEIVSVYERVLERLREAPGVSHSSASWHAPFLFIPRMTFPVEREGLPSSESEAEPRALFDVVMPGYLETMGIHLLEGRALTAEDREGAPRVVLVGETTARALWPGRSAVGRRIRLSFDDSWYTVVGVFTDLRYEGMRGEAMSPVFGSRLQNPAIYGIRLNLVVKTTQDPLGMVGPLRDIVRSVDGHVLIQESRIMTTVISESAVDDRYRALLLGSFALAALLISGIGIFGVTARSVAQRSREIAIRVALGAEEETLAAFVLRTSLLAALVGIGVGLGCAYLGGDSLSGFLFQVDAHDPRIYGAVAGMVLLTYLLAVFVPARRVLAMDPAEVLREE